MLNRRRMISQKIVSDVWDYEWVYTPGGVYPPNMTYGSIKDTGSGLLVVAPNLAFSDSNGTGDAEIFVRARISAQSSDPQYCIVHSPKKGFKVYSNGTYIISNVTGKMSNIILQSAVESVGLKFKDNVASLYINENFVSSGPGVENNVYLNFTGILSATTVGKGAIVDLTEIRYRRL